jgi:aminoglycoside phosphotransferase family enzyme
VNAEAACVGPPGLEQVLRFLGSDAAHAGYAGRDGVAPQVEIVETHMSWVFLVGNHVLKLKKPVRYPFLDFSTLAARKACCREEVRLNSRLAPGIYRGLMAVQWFNGQLMLRAEADASETLARTVEWLVWMKRLPQAQMLDRMLADGRVDAAAVDALLAVLCGFYRDASSGETDAASYAARFEREQAINRELLLRPQFSLRGLDEVLDRFDRALQRSRGMLRARAAGGRIVDGHGDLRPEHVCLLSPPVVIDCLEFNAALRQVDPFDELAFLALECDLLGASWIGPQLVDGCAAALGDAPPASLLHLYTAGRALLRARLAMAHLLEPAPRTPLRWAAQAQRYVGRALCALDAFERGDAFSAATPRGTP